MRWSTTTLIWLFATSTLAFPFGEHSSRGLTLEVERSSEPALKRYTDTYYSEKTVLPSLRKHSLTTRAIADGHFTREELDWLSQKSLTDVDTAGLKDTTTALKDLFGKNDIPWVISGGWALILYGEPDRNTPDIDIVVQITMPELKKLLEADGRFVIPADDWWPDDAHLQVYYQTQGKYFDVDMIIAGQKNSVKEVASITQFVSTTHGTKELAIPVIRIGPIFISKVYGLASPKRKKHEQDVKDISWLIANHPDDLVNMPKDLPLDKRQVVVDYLTRFKSTSLPKAKELLDL